MRSPEGGYTERHLPISDGRGLHAHRARPRRGPRSRPAPSDATAWPAARCTGMAQLRARLSQCWFADNIQKPTVEELEEAHHHAEHEEDAARALDQPATAATSSTTSSTAGDDAARGRRPGAPPRADALRSGCARDTATGPAVIEPDGSTPAGAVPGRRAPTAGHHVAGASRRPGTADCGRPWPGPEPTGCRDYAGRPGRRTLPRSLHGEARTTRRRQSAEPLRTSREGLVPVAVAVGRASSAGRCRCTRRRRRRLVMS